ncbi:hypothetical protein CF327_g7731 [Tilletia walkeri]|nr:hypothetical protein CF327_g7731 [Tilletia walkeri]
MLYVFQRVQLHRQAFGYLFTEDTLAQEVGSGLPESMRALLRLAPNDMSPATVQDVLRDWEMTWREVHAVPLTTTQEVKSAPSMTAPATIATVALTSPHPRTLHSDQSSATTAAKPGFTPAQASVAPSSLTSASVASLAASSNSSRAIPTDGSQPRLDRRPHSLKVMKLDRDCVTSGSQHFDFEHDHLLCIGQDPPRPHQSPDELAMSSMPFVSTGACTFALAFVVHPDLVHAVLDSGENSGVGWIDERLAAVEALLADARELMLVARRGQPRKYVGSRASPPVCAVGDVVYARLADRSVPGSPTHKPAPRILGPFCIRELIGDHRVRLALQDHLRDSKTFSNSQVDVAPVGEPYLTHRAAPSVPTAADAPSSSYSRVQPPLSLPSRP